MWLLTLVQESHCPMKLKYWNGEGVVPGIEDKSDVGGVEVRREKYRAVYLTISTVSVLSWQLWGGDGETNDITWREPLTWKLVFLNCITHSHPHSPPFPLSSHTHSPPLPPLLCSPPTHLSRLQLLWSHLKVLISSENTVSEEEKKSIFARKNSDWSVQVTWLTALMKVDT